MLIRPPRYRRSLFRTPQPDIEATQRYMSQESLAADPRMRAISDFEQQVVRDAIAALPKGATVVDVPCGNGRMSRWAAARRDLELVALDFAPNMLRAAESQVPPNGLSRRVRADVLALPLPDKCADLVINMRLMHHVKDDDTRLRMLRQLGRVCRGRLVTSFWSTHSWRYLRRRLLAKDIRGFPIAPRHFRRLCQRAGLKVLDLSPVRPWYEEQCLAVCQPL